MMAKFRLYLKALIGIGALAVVCVLPSPVSALTLDVVSSFPDIQGENGLYVQGYNPETSVFRLLDHIGTQSFGSLGGPGPANIPKAVKSGSRVAMHPTTNGTVNGKIEWVVVSWLVPQSGTYVVSGLFCNVQTTSPGCTTIGNVFVNSNSANPLFSGAVNINTTAVFNLTSVYLTAGDYLRFAVDSGVDYTRDNTGLAAFITSTAPATTPEPGSLAAIAVGLVGLVTMRRRKR